MRARIEDVANAAGVSTATVSLVLRGRPGPSAATREHVRAIATQLGYRPDRAASALARHRSHLVGVLLDITSSFHAELVVALDAASAAYGLELVLSSVTPRRDEQSAVETLLDFRCEGVLLLGPGMPDSELRELGARCPSVVIGRAGTGSVPGVRAGDEQGMGAAVDHLTALGHRRIAYVDGPRGSIATARRGGYRRAMTRHGMRDLLDIRPGGQTEEAGVRAGSALLELDLAQRPTAVLCFNDRVALGLRDSLLRAGIAVPEQLSLIGYDDSAPARLGTVDLSSVSQDPDHLAGAALALLAGRLDGAEQTAPGRDVVISPRLVARSSTAPPR